MSSCNWWEFLPFLQGCCQSTCTALMAAGWARRMWNSLASTRYAVHGWCTHNVPSHWLFFRLILNSMEIIFCCHVIIKSLYLSIRLEPHLNTASICQRIQRICQASQNHSQKTPHHNFSEASDIFEKAAFVVLIYLTCLGGNCAHSFHVGMR